MYVYYHIFFITLEQNEKKNKEDKYFGLLFQKKNIWKRLPATETNVRKKLKQRFDTQLKSFFNKKKTVFELKLDFSNIFFFHR